MTYREAVKYINEIPKFTKKTDLDHTRRLLAALGHPERGQRILHVAGTNGKGSTCAFLTSMLTEGGYRCGLFTSPHLERINERFSIAGQDVSDAAFAAAFDKVMEAAKLCMAKGDVHPTYFETLFLMGMVLFAEAKVDYIILETGLGGRLDATNVIESPLACIITSISRDHTEYLGETIPEIAGEKAGILKAGIPVIYDNTVPEASAVIRNRARALTCPAVGIRCSGDILAADLLLPDGTTADCCRERGTCPHSEETDCSVKKGGDLAAGQPDVTMQQKEWRSAGTSSGTGEGADFVAAMLGDLVDLHRQNNVNCMEAEEKKDKDLRESLENLQETLRETITFSASYQLQNAALALTAMKLLQPEHGISDETCLAGIAHAHWPCRMERLAEGVYVDGAHNEDGIAKFIESVQELRKTEQTGADGNKENCSQCCNRSRQGKTLPLTLLFSAVADKRYREMVQELSEELAPGKVIVTEFGDSRGASADHLAGLFRENGIKNVVALPDTEAACALALKEKGEGLLCCVGSLYLAGKAAPILRRLVK